MNISTVWASINSLRIREELKPYLIRIMAQAHEWGRPVIRPLFYDFPEDSASWEVEDEYMFGPDLLIAPVMYPGLRERSVSLPRGCSWKEQETGTLYQGGRQIRSAAPLDTIPVFEKSCPSMADPGSHP
ncbi:MAG: hypothetical protein LBP74_06755 [Treponema sp.]|jgi:alpha-D-xyloside xylohydrolase|nr:hypothetical protein [Treponema sp.]